MLKRSAFPASVTKTWINCIGLLCFLAGVMALICHPQNSSTLSIFFLMLCWFLPIVILEFFFLPQVRLAWKRNSKQLPLKQCLIRCLGLYLTFAIFALGYWVFPEYRDAFYQPWWDFLSFSLPFMILLSFPYFYWHADQDETCSTNNPYEQLGLLFFGQTKQLNSALLTQHFLAWLVKAFFLPLMIAYCWSSISNIEQYQLPLLLQHFHACITQLIHPSSINHSTHSLANDFAYLFNFSWVLLFLIDLAIVCVGYALSLRLFDNQINSTEPTFLGWAVALACYAPFNNILSTSYLSYTRDHFTWGNWLMAYDFMYVLWGLVILLLCGIYVSASVAFGLRFSNLTHRGIITNGPYRYLKHPAYVAKNLSWWLISIPFIIHNQDYNLALRCALMLLLLNFIYYLRAKTEERHLSHDPAYIAYSKAIDTQGLIRKSKNYINSIKKLIIC